MSISTHFRALTLEPSLPTESISPESTSSSFSAATPLSTSPSVDASSRSEISLSSSPTPSPSPTASLATAVIAQLTSFSTSSPHRVAPNRATMETFTVSLLSIPETDKSPGFGKTLGLPTSPVSSFSAPSTRPTAVSAHKMDAQSTQATAYESPSSSSSSSSPLSSSSSCKLTPKAIKKQIEQRTGIQYKRIALTKEEKEKYRKEPLLHLVSDEVLLNSEFDKIYDSAVGDNDANTGIEYTDVDKAIREWEAEKSEEVYNAWLFDYIQAETGIDIEFDSEDQEMYQKKPHNRIFSRAVRENTDFREAVKLCGKHGPRKGIDLWYNKLFFDIQKSTNITITFSTSTDKEYQRNPRMRIFSPEAKANTDFYKACAFCLGHGLVKGIRLWKESKRNQEEEKG